MTIIKIFFRSYFLIDSLFLNFFLFENTNTFIEKFLKFLDILFASAYTFNLIGIVVERVISTKFSKSYEKSQKPAYFVLLLPVGLILMITITIHVAVC